MPKRRDRPTIGSTRCTTRCTAATCWSAPTSAAVPTAAQPGVDGQTFEDIEAYGLDRWLDELADELRKRDVSTATGAARVHPETGWQATAAGDPDDPGSRGADGGGAGPGADLRGRPAAGAIRLPAGPQCPGRRQAGPRAAEHGAYGGGRRRLVRLLRQHPARRADEVGVPSHQRSAPAAADQDVAGGTGGRDRRAGPSSSDDPQQGRGPGQPARVSALAVVGEPLHASVHPGLEDAGARAAVSTLTSSTMPTTS